MSTTPASVLQSLSDDLAAAVERASPSIVAIHARRRIPSSGVLWQPGVVVTTHHTLQREENITVTLGDGSTVAATLAGRDATTDLAVLRLEGAPGAVAPRTSPADEVRVGQIVLALGRPGPSVTAALGIVSAAAGEWRTWHGGRIDRFIRLDLAIHDGFSGGPLVDARGDVIGINSSAVARAAAITIPALTVDRVVGQLLTSGHVRRGYLGVGVQAVKLPAGLVAAHALGRDVGLMVISVEEGGPAHDAGISLGDVIVSFAGSAVSDAAELLAALSGDRAGATVAIQLLRGGELRERSVTVGERASGGPRS